uniref:Putative lipoprotein n=1 Tax=uncultured bacterium contig00042 TaxID=1181529 RepID=A0A806JZG3_9BACT|nr:putative lipoprotein [uncultured bacterium contig00042]
MGFFLLFTVLLVSCGGNTAVIWTDRPEFALYGDYFNTVQNQYKVTVRYLEYPGEALEDSHVNPDIVVGSWLKNFSTDTYFKSLDGLFGKKKIPRNLFYSKILTAGKAGRNQHLLPVSFNIPALIFSKEREHDIINSFTIDFEEVKQLSKGYNVESRSTYTRMGFSPLWDDNFLLTAAVLYGVSFREALPLAWDTTALDKSMDYIYNWTHEINSNNQAEEEFTFKYFIEPPERLAISGRILFSYMESNELFTLTEENKNHIDFRWIMEQDRVPITDASVFLGIHKRAKAKRAAKAFVLWFFQTENQRLLMEYFRVNGINEGVFWDMRRVFLADPGYGADFFRIFYPELLGRMPPAEYLMPPNVLPGNWAIIKERVVLPYLHDRARTTNISEVYPLERRLSDWIRMNR